MASESLQSREEASLFTTTLVLASTAPSHVTVIPTQLKSDSDSKHLRVSNPDLWVAEHIVEQISVSNPDWWVAEHIVEQ